MCPGRTGTAGEDPERFELPTFWFVPSSGALSQGVSECGACCGSPVPTGDLRLIIFDPLGTANNLASGSPITTSVTSKFCVPNRGSLRLLLRLMPNSGEYQYSRLTSNGLLLYWMPKNSQNS